MDPWYPQMQKAYSKHCHFMTSTTNYNVFDLACGMVLLIYHPQMLTESTRVSRFSSII